MIPLKIPIWLSRADKLKKQLLGKAVIQSSKNIYLYMEHDMDQVVAYTY